MDRMSALPRPYPDPVLLQQVLDAGFRRYPEREANYKKFKAAERGERLDYLPVRLDIEHVSRCNYRCTMCQVSDWPGMKRADDMSFEDFKRLIDSQYGLIEIKLQGMGEPLLGPCYFDMIRYARSRHIWVRSTTNASLLHLKENYRHLMDSDICDLQVSIDGATAPTYEAIRRGGRFETVKENCRQLNAYAKAVNRQRIRMFTVLQASNIQEAERFPEVAAELGFIRMTLSLDLNDWGQDAWRARNDPVDIHRAFNLERAFAIIERGKALGVEVTYWFTDDKYDTTDPGKLCPWPFERGYVSSDMRFVPCCMIANPDVVDLGDARDLAEAWNGRRMAAFRKLHLTGRIPKACRSCYKAQAPAAVEASAQAPAAEAAGA
jgi:pyrroloquinoline quinone biosynthesis protein E